MQKLMKLAVIGSPLSASVHIDGPKIGPQHTQTIAADHLQNYICTAGHGCRGLQAQFSVQRGE